MEIPKHFDYSREDEIYRQWEKSGFFNPDAFQRAEKEKFVISMPPPNATGTLHLGHASMLVYQDVMTRFYRMKGYDTLWLPGTDHAGIATQTKVEKILFDEEGKTRHDLGREAFLQKVEAFVRDSQDTIRNQVRKMGASCDWSRERYTLDAGLTRSVQEIFIRMYRDGLIYRGKRIVHWCPRCASTLADDEVLYKPEKTKFYYLKYGPVVIGTARPETKFLDKTIVVHPDDARYKELLGKKLMIPWITGEVEARIIADESADMTLGSGAMTLTPAHSFIDFDLAKKYNLEIVQIIDENGNFTEAAGKEFSGKNARENREKIVEVLKSRGLVDRIDEAYEHNLSICYRCETPIEPLISDQWFIDVNKPIVNEEGKQISLKQKASEVVADGKIKIIPERFQKTYFQWMDHLRDWCISRQLWFGHRIPVWYCRGKTRDLQSSAGNLEGLSDSGDSSDSDSVRHETCQPIASIEKPTICPNCGSKDFFQDPDTLDTWFSSGLWTFSTLGWPDNTSDLKRFHPTSVLETGYDILFFWVARMILMTEYALGEIPFQRVYLHGLVLDEKGQKMSKSKGNIIDPLEIISEMGTDALRLSLFIGATPGNNLRLGKEKVLSYRNFITKIWNICRFILSRIDEGQTIDAKKIPQSKTLADEFILSKLGAVSRDVQEKIRKFQFSAAAENLYAFTREDLADWYLEIAKVEKGKDEILGYIIVHLLMLWHPFIPFVTEELYQRIKLSFSGDFKDFLMIEEIFESVGKEIVDEQMMEFDQVRNVITAIRTFRADNKIPASEKINASLQASKEEAFLKYKEVIMKMARLGNLEIGKKFENKDAKHIPLAGLELFVHTDEKHDMINAKKVQKDKETLTLYIRSMEEKLINPGFIEKAPPAIVVAEKKKLAEAKERLGKMIEE